MKAKKHPNLQVEKHSGTFFVAGLAFILALSYIAIEWKSFAKATPKAQNGIALISIDEEVPITLQQLPEPPKPIIKSPVIITIKEDDVEVPESIINLPESTDDLTELDYTAIETLAVEEEEEVSFIAVEDAPIFPGCEGATDKKACFQEMMLKHIKKTFKYPETAIDMQLQGKVHVLFTIDKGGYITNIKMRGPHELLEKEAARIMSKLPTMQPGKQRGRPVKVPFSIPINFKLQ
ncbi:energy transducer TonB [Croceivirga sp. JEA036]|uniref:energy transducer TonB n=1 Tax=Croceivirga sp. JEA036 TaxID=2721162 RepID=UPI0014395DED|nr:energy transducer TonB [Croceivirga sp. JEA036]NJB36144.1 energy transducer TonB [Croceivirga sp. JEA036]